MNTQTLGPRVRAKDRVVFVALAVIALLCVAVAADIVGFVVLLIPIAILFFAFVVFVARRPVTAAYVFLATQPFVGGIDRGQLIPLLRPSEAIQAVVTGAVLCGLLVRIVHGERLSVRITRLDRAIVLLCALSSLWPLFWMLARGRVPSSTDLYDTVVLWRLAALYVLFRWVIRTREQVRRCLWILLVSASLLAVLAILDSLGIWHATGPWTPTVGDDSTGRGGATLDSAIAVGDYLAYSFAVVLVWLLRTKEHRGVILAAAGVIFLGILGTGQFSAWIEGFIVVVVVAHHEGQLSRLAKWLGPIAAVGAIIAWPVISTRLAGFGGGALPHSWQGRIDNLTHFYLPQLSGFHWVLGIRPDTVLQAPETWRTVIYLESGYLWLFWVGGIPLVAGFLWFLWHGFRHTKRVAKERADDDIGIATMGARAALWCLLIMSLTDPHLTLRGGSDLFFCLLGLSANLIVPRRDPRPDVPFEPRPELSKPWVRQVSSP